MSWWFAFCFAITNWNKCRQLIAIFRVRNIDLSLYRWWRCCSFMVFSSNLVFSFSFSLLSIFYFIWSDFRLKKKKKKHFFLYTLSKTIHQGEIYEEIDVLCFLHVTWFDRRWWWTFNFYLLVREIIYLDPTRLVSIKLLVSQTLYIFSIVISQQVVCYSCHLCNAHFETKEDQDIKEVFRLLICVF